MKLILALVATTLLVSDGFAQCSNGRCGPPQRFSRQRFQQPASNAGWAYQTTPLSNPRIGRETVRQLPQAPSQAVLDEILSIRKAIADLNSRLSKVEEALLHR